MLDALTNYIFPNIRSGAAILKLMFRSISVGAYLIIYKSATALLKLGPNKVSLICRESPIAVAKNQIWSTNLIHLNAFPSGQIIPKQVGTNLDAISGHFREVQQHRILF